MSATRTHKVSRLGIDTKSYAYRFQREPHFIGFLRDKDQSYFNVFERLTDTEVTEIENWPKTVSELYDGEEYKRAKGHFLRCLRGQVEPETSTEFIVTKLIHQALAMGGLHCGNAVVGSVVPEFPQDLPENDICELRALPLRSFLFEIKDEMAGHTKEAWKETTKQHILDDVVDHETYEDDAYDMGMPPDPRWNEDEQLMDLTDEEVGLPERKPD